MLAVLVLVSLAGWASAQQTAGEKTAEQVFKNIQVFQGKPANELRPTMDFIASSLGVHCSFCHNTRDFSSDVKPTKRRARQMIAMVFAVNKSTFGGRNEVNCYTCHRGSAHPDGRLSLASLTASAPPRPPQRPERSQQDLPGAARILAKYVAAIGGGSALAAIHNETVSAQRVAFGRTSPVQLTRADGKVVLSQGASSKSGFDGSTYWTSGKRGTNLNPESSTIAQLRVDRPLYPAAEVDPTHARVFSEQEVDGQQAYVVGVRTANGFDSYAFDAATGLLLRYTTGAPTFLGTLPLQVDYSDWRQVGNVKLPFDLIFDTHDFHWQRKISHIRLNGDVDAARFQAPAGR